MAQIDLDKIKKAGDYIRYLSLSAIENAKSGHPGLPMGCADLGVILYRYILKYNPEVPAWINRDRFVLSAGHGSILLYSLLHCAGYPFTLADLAEFRQLGSKTPGHPEYNIPMGIETTTGPLGQGFANAVGMAIEQKMLASRFNKDGLPLFDYNIYTLLGDGCMMEGVVYEAASMAGHLGLDNLIAIYDSNNISIDGSIDITFSDDVKKRFESQGWVVERCDALHFEDYHHKLQQLKEMKGKPKLLIVNTVIGWGLDKLKGSNKVHGAPAGVSELAYFIQNSEVKRLFRKVCGDIVEENSALRELCERNIAERKIPIESVEDSQFIKEAMKENHEKYTAWLKLYLAYEKQFPNEFQELQKMFQCRVSSALREKLLNYREEKADATRSVSGRLLNICADELPQIVGGAADLVESTKTVVKSSSLFSKSNPGGRNIAFGIREHAMGAIGNGLALNRTLLPFTSTFFTFFDYMKPALRLSALMKLKHLFIFTHDSFYVGEDGPTHQPIEHLNSLRLIPDMVTFRPANALETAFSYLYYLEGLEGPAALLCTRQNIQEDIFRFDGDRSSLYEEFKRGAIVVYETDKRSMPDIVLSASGSEVGLVYSAARILEERDGKKVRVISVPSLELFEQSPEDYRKSLLADGIVPFVYVEASSFRGVGLFVNGPNHIIGINEFGVSGPANKVAEKIGFTPEAIYSRLKSLI